MIKKRMKVASIIVAGVIATISFMAVGTLIATPYQALAEGATYGSNLYTVKSGDSLYKIAASYGVTITGLKQANGLYSDLIIPGQVLKIPVKTPTAAGNYTVRRGDTLFGLASKNGITIADLKYTNALSSDTIMVGQVLEIPAKQVKSLKVILAEKGIAVPVNNLVIKVDKTDHTLSVLAGNVFLKSYHIELGDSGLGDKQISGDHKTPEGTFYVSQKAVLSPADEFLGTRWMRLSYPNIEDADRGLSQGLIGQQTRNDIVAAFNNKLITPQQTALGGGVGIHGGSTPQLGSDWTWGCVGLSNYDVEDFYDYVKVATPVIIKY